VGAAGADGGAAGCDVPSPPHDEIRPALKNSATQKAFRRRKDETMLCEPRFLIEARGKIFALILFYMGRVKSLRYTMNGAPTPKGGAGLNPPAARFVMSPPLWVEGKKVSNGSIRVAFPDVESRMVRVIGVYCLPLC
jgi:hypothetical protein